MPSKRIGIIGSGQVGQVLASAFSTLGYETKIGSRSPEKLKEFLSHGGEKISSGTLEETASFGDVLVLATNGDVSEEAVSLAGPKNFSNKIVIDATNPLDFSKGMPPGIIQRYSEKSLGERIQEKLVDASVVKCFNTIPNSLMFRPKLEGASMLICGNDADAKARVTAILNEFGWAGSIDVGGIENARWLEAIVPLWVRAAGATGEWVSMFKFVK